MGCRHSSKEKKEDSRPEITVVEENETDAQNFKGTIAVALYSLEIEDGVILNFSAGDKFVIEDDSDPDWFLARHINGQKKGFVPKNYMNVDVNVGNEKWFFGDTSRADAERLLLQPENALGTFMVRNSHVSGIYALSIKDVRSEISYEEVVRHYQIRMLDNGGYFIAPNVAFSSLKQLVAYYSIAAKGLCRKLGQPCPKRKPVIPGPSPDVKDEYEIPYSSLTFDRKLGKGHFGEVFYGYWNRTFEVAIKCIETSGMHSEDFRREVAVMKAVNHPKIVHLYAVCTEKNPYCIVMEYMCNGNLHQHLNTPHGKMLKLPSLIIIAAQIADGMHYLESHHLIHRDLAARNILVGDGDIVKLADFGLARIMEEAVYVTAAGGKVPIKWTAPEAYTSGAFTIKSDVWSFGIVLYEIFTHGDLPYPGMKNQQVLELVTKQNYRMPKPDDPECSDTVYNIMLLCWRKIPRTRPTFEYLYDFFYNYFISSEKPYIEAE